MLSGTHCGLLLLYRSLAVALTMDAFPRLTPLDLRAVPLLVNLACHTQNHSWLAYRRFLSAFTPAPLALSRESCSSAPLPCGLVPAAATDLGSRHFAVCRRAASLTSTTAWSGYCLAIMLNGASGSCVTRLNRIYLPFHLAAELDCLNSLAIASTCNLPSFSV